MNIIVNGSERHCPTDSNLSELLTLLDMQDKKIALEINKEVISRGEYDSYILNEGDAVEIIQAIGGG